MRKNNDAGDNSAQMRKPSNSSKARKRKNNNRRNNKPKDTVDKDTMSKSGNDPAWYASDPNILRDAASYPFSWPTGATKTHDLTLYDTSYKAPYADIPGICSLEITPAIGFTIRATDPVNVAAQSVYSFIRHANSGHSNYDAPDLFLYILGMANCYSYLVWCQRLYGYALTYDQRNRYIPNELIRLNNVDPDDLRANLANFRFWINTLIAKMSSFAVPATFSIFSRMSFMYSDYYIEGTSIKEQLYQFVPAGFFKFGLDSQSRGKLIWTPFDRTELMSTKDIEDLGNEIFGSIWDEEDFGIMSGDILKAYGDRIIKLVSIPETYTISPKFDPVVLTQMKNAIILRAEGADIGQADGIITQTISPKNYTTDDTYWGVPNHFDNGDITRLTQLRIRNLKDFKVMTVDTDNPTPDVVMEASRLMWSYDAYLGELRLGTEFVSAVYLTYAVGSDYKFEQINACWLAAGMTGSIGGFAHASEVVRHFHYVPRIWWGGPIDDTSQSGLLEWFDVDNFAILDNNDLAKLHQAAVINMYAVPSIGKVQ